MENNNRICRDNNLPLTAINCCNYKRESLNDFSVDLLFD